MKADNDTGVEEDMPFTGFSPSFILTKPWSFCSRSRNIKNRDNKVYERALTLWQDESQNLPSEELLVRGNSVSIHKKISKLSLQKSSKQNNGFHRKQIQIYYNL